MVQISVILRHPANKEEVYRLLEKSNIKEVDHRILAEANTQEVSSLIHNLNILSGVLATVIDEEQ